MRIRGRREEGGVWSEMRFFAKLSFTRNRRAFAPFEVSYFATYFKIRFFLQNICLLAKL